MNELSDQIINDGQIVRAVYNYIGETYNGVKNKELFDATIKDRIEFYEIVRDVCDMLIKSNTAFKEDHPEEYLSAN